MSHNVTIRVGADEAFEMEERVSVSVDLGDGEELVIVATDEGLIIDAYRNGQEAGTIGRMYDEWHAAATGGT